MKIIIILTISSFSIIIIALILLVYYRYKDFLFLKYIEDPDYKEDLGGLFVGDEGKIMNGSFQFCIPLPIEDNRTDKQIINAIVHHNKIIRLFWTVIFIFIPVLFFKVT